MTPLKQEERLELTNNHQGKLKPPLHRLPVHLVGEVSKANISLQILLLLQERKITHKSKPQKYILSHLIQN